MKHETSIKVNWLITIIPTHFPFNLYLKETSSFWEHHEIEKEFSILTVTRLIILNPYTISMDIVLIDKLLSTLSINICKLIPLTATHVHAITQLPQHGVGCLGSWAAPFPHHFFPSHYSDRGLSWFHLSERIWVQKSGCLNKTIRLHPVVNPLYWHSWKHLWIADFDNVCNIETWLVSMFFNVSLHRGKDSAIIHNPSSTSLVNPKEGSGQHLKPTPDLASA